MFRSMLSRIARRVRPCLECLEERWVPAVFDVAAHDSEGLIAAIKAANANGQANTIELAAGSEYDLSAVDNYWYGANGLPAISSNLTIDGHGATIERIGSTPFRIFYVAGGLDNAALMPAGTLTLENVTISGGLAKGGDGGSGFAAGGGGAGLGGGIFNQGTLTLFGVTLTDNTAQGGTGGVQESFSVVGSGGGGGLGGNGGSTTTNASAGGGGFAANGVDGAGDNGGAGGTGLVTGDGGGGATPSAVGANGTSPFGGDGAAGSTSSVGGGGGGFRATDDASGTAGGGQGQLGDAGHDGGSGGNPSNAATTMGGGGGAFGGGGGGGSGLNENYGGAGGGGGVGGGGGGGHQNYANGGSGGFGGGGGGASGVGGFGGGGGGGQGYSVAGNGGFGGGNGVGPGTAGGSGGGGAGFGGALFNHGGTVTIVDSTIASNSALGGDGGHWADGTPGLGASALGGALFNLNGTVNLLNDTFAGNTVVAGQYAQYSGNLALGDDAYNLVFGNIINTGGAAHATLNVANVIFGSDSSSAELANDRRDGNAANDATINLTGPSVALHDVSTANGSVTNNGIALIVSDAHLGSMQNNGGPTATMELLSGSPALYMGADLNAAFQNMNLPTTDQRGVSRGDLWNIGSYQATPTELHLSGLPAYTKAGTPLNVTATAFDSLGKTAIDYPGRMTWTATGAAQVPPTGVLHGAAAVTLDTAGLETIFVGDDHLSAQANVQVLPGAAVQVVASGGSHSTAVDDTFGGHLQAWVADALGNGVPGVSVTFNAPANGRSGSFANGKQSITIATNDAGFATAPVFTANEAAGDYSVQVSDSADHLSDFVPLTNVAGQPEIINLLGDQFRRTVVGTAYTALQVQVTDAFGNPVANKFVQFALPPTGASGTFAGSPWVLTDSQGIATAPTVIANHTRGTFSVVAMMSGVNPPSPFALTNLAAPTAVTVVSGAKQVVTVGTAVPKAFQVKVTDANGKPINGITVEFATSNGRFAGPGAVTTDSNGIATAPAFTAGGAAGAFNVEARVSGMAAPTLIALTANPGTAAIISPVTATLSATVGKAYALQAVVTDAFGNPLKGVKVTFTVPNGTGAGGNFGGKATATAVSDKNGIAAVPLTASTVAGSFTVSASAAGVNTPTSFNLTNKPDMAAKVIIVSGNNQIAAAGSDFAAPLTVKVTDRYGNVLEGVSVTFQVHQDPRTGAAGNFGGSASVTVTTDATGHATTPTLKAGVNAGKFTITTSITGVLSSPPFSLTVA